MKTADQRLIEDYLPVDWLSAEASGEPRTKGHLSTLHLWRARRPLVACRAAIYSALVKAPAAEKRKEQESFLKALCQWGAPENLLQQARRHISDNRDDAPRVSRLFCRWRRYPTRSPPFGMQLIRCGSEPGRLSDPQGYLRIPTTVRSFLIRGRASLGRAGGRTRSRCYRGLLSYNSHPRRSPDRRSGSDEA